MKSTTKIAIVVFLSVVQFYYAFGHTGRGNLTTKWVYVPDKHGNFYWLDLDKVPALGPFNPNDVKFYLYTKWNANAAQVLRLNNIMDLIVTYYNKDKPTRVICHGYFSDGESDFSERIKNAYLKAGDFNVIVVDWSRVSTDFYNIAAERTVDVGKTIASLFNFYYEQGYLKSFDNINMAGHSLGAHVVGNAGKNLKSKAKVIYGLDPAGPLFSLNEPTKRMDKDDAQLTVGVRTDMGGYGFEHSLAHMDFLPNKGQKQPGCPTNRGESVIKSCSHSRAWEFFEESLNPGEKKFRATGCTNFFGIRNGECPHSGVSSILLGENIVRAPGYFYLWTAAESPFALGTHGKPA